MKKIKFISILMLLTVTITYGQTGKEIGAGVLDFLLSSPKTYNKMSTDQRIAAGLLSDLLKTQAQRQHEINYAESGADKIIINTDDGRQAQVVKDVQGNVYLLYNGIIYPVAQSFVNQAKMDVQIQGFNINDKDTVVTRSGLKYIIVEKAANNTAQPIPGHKVEVNYTGYLINGKMFDSSFKRNQPFMFTFGVGNVIKGWDEGIALMNEGDKYRFIIPYQLAYGENGYPDAIPPKATLIFDIELLKVY